MFVGTVHRLRCKRCFRSFRQMNATLFLHRSLSRRPFQQSYMHFGTDTVYFVRVAFHGRSVRTGQYCTTVRHVGFIEGRIISAVESVVCMDRAVTRVTFVTVRSLAAVRIDTGSIDVVHVQTRDEICRCSRRPRRYIAIRSRRETDYVRCRTVRRYDYGDYRRTLAYRLLN